jgi:8-oxo-dGTP diphosphatase
MNKVHRKIIKVTCAIIEKNGEILAAQRSENMSLPLEWEFPGGKIEINETPEECITRELKEELNIEVKIVKKLMPHVHHYAEKSVELIPFICSIEHGEIHCKEHKEVIWDRADRLRSLDWAEADIPIYKEYLNHIKGTKLY